MKRAGLYSDLLQTLKRAPLTALVFQQRGGLYLRPQYPATGGAQSTGVGVPGRWGGGGDERAVSVCGY